ncbi:hypothetical protein GCM10009525_68770 [Streptosporangium amethystogenes subsp. fukuiense]
MSTRVAAWAPVARTSLAVPAMPSRAQRFSSAASVTTRATQNIRPARTTAAIRTPATATRVPPRGAATHTALYVTSRCTLITRPSLLLSTVSTSKVLMATLLSAPVHPVSSIASPKKIGPAPYAAMRSASTQIHSWAKSVEFLGLSLR